MAIIDQYLGSRFSIGRFEQFEIQFDIEGNISSRMQARVFDGSLAGSFDLLQGYRRTRGNFGGGSFLAPPSEPPVSLPNEALGLPFYPAYGGITTYSQAGPTDGRY